MYTSPYYSFMICAAMALPLESSPVLAQQYQQQHTETLYLEPRGDEAADEPSIHWIPARAVFALLCLFIFFVVLHILQATIFHKVYAVMGNYQGDCFEYKEESQIKLPENP